ncbi:Uncharacterized protein APZ42_007515 [Daphnia magna]|uniref:Uncharacterized protein n=1 Tax=Daphnia magna TaxID=35525 RepID=A0A164F8K8_9CRUS|nr:Uncharacterized protein APZ42_007515 [Daphnia magna]
MNHFHTFILCGQLLWSSLPTNHQRCHAPIFACVTNRRLKEMPHTVSC